MRSAGIVDIAPEEWFRRVSSKFVFSCDWCTLSFVALLSLRRSRIPLLLESLGRGAVTVEELEACVAELSGLTSFGIIRLP